MVGEPPACKLVKYWLPTAPVHGACAYILTSITWIITLFWILHGSVLNIIVQLLTIVILDMMWYPPENNNTDWGDSQG